MPDKINVQLQSRSVFKNMAILATGTGVAKVVGALSILIITRIYTPEDLGVLSVFVSLLALLIPFGSFRYAMALPLPRHDVLALNLVVLSTFILIAVSLISTLLLALFVQPIMNLLSMPMLIPYWWLLSIGLFGAGLYEILQLWAVRKKSFKLIAKTKVWQSFLGAITKIALGLVGLIPIGLLIGQIIVQTAGVFSLSRGLLKSIKINQKKINKRRMFFLLKYYRDYPKFRLPSQFLMVFSVQAPLLFSAWMFGAEVTGQLGLALMALALPISLFGNSVGQAYYAEIAKIGRNEPEKIYNLTKKVTLKLFYIGVVPTLFLFLLGPWFFKLVFGDEWSQAGLFVSILAGYLLMQFISAPIVNVLSVFEQQLEFLFINIRRLLLILSVFLLSYIYKMDIVATLTIFSLTLALHYLWVVFSIFKVIKKHVL